MMGNIITVAIALPCLLFVIILLIQGKKRYGDGYSALNKKEFPLRDMMYMGAYFGYDILKEKHLDIAPRQVEKARQIYGQMSGRREVENKVRLFYIHKLTLLALLIGAASLIGLMTGVQGLLDGEPPKPVEVTQIERPNFLEGDKEITYQVIAENENPEDVENKQSDVRVSISIPRQDPTEAELQEAVERTKQNIDTKALGDNEDWEHIRYSMNFYEYDKQTGITLEWDREDDSIFYTDGEIKNSARPEEGKTEEITVSLYYKEEKLDEVTKKMRILPIQYTDQQLRENAVKEASADINQQGQLVEKDKVILPGADEEKQVQMQWFEYTEIMQTKSGSNALQYFILFFIIAVIVYFAYDQELQRQMDERKAEIESEFPIFIDKFVLLLNCGNSVFGALNQSIQSAVANNPEKQNHPLYEELMILRQEIQQGISDVDAFENFGRRVRISNIMKFSSLIGQAIRKGDKEISNSLTGLVKEAWEKKKQIAKERGAQASTKMMLPLAIMLIAIVMMIMAPAIFQMSL